MREIRLHSTFFRLKICQRPHKNNLKHNNILTKLPEALGVNLKHTNSVL